MLTDARFATPDDAAELVLLRALMFEAMGIDASDDAWRHACHGYLQERLQNGKIVAAVADAPDGIGLASSGLAEVSAQVPSPLNPSGLAAYLSSFSTDPRWRRQGMARNVLLLLLDHLRAVGVHRVELHATPDGLPLYRQFGFKRRPGGQEMRLDL